MKLQNCPMRDYYISDSFFFSNLNTRLEFKQIPRNLDTQLKQVFYINSLPGLLFACFKKHFYQIENSSIVFDFFFPYQYFQFCCPGWGKKRMHRARYSISKLNFHLPQRLPLYLSISTVSENFSRFHSPTLPEKKVRRDSVKQYTLLSSRYLKVRHRNFTSSEWLDLYSMQCIHHKTILYKQNIEPVALPLPECIISYTYYW